MRLRSTDVAVAINVSTVMVPLAFARLLHIPAIVELEMLARLPTKILSKSQVRVYRFAVAFTLALTFSLTFPLTFTLAPSWGSRTLIIAFLILPIAAAAAALALARFILSIMTIVTIFLTLTFALRLAIALRPFRGVGVLTPQFDK